MARWTNHYPALKRFQVIDIFRHGKLDDNFVGVRGIKVKQGGSDGDTTDLILPMPLMRCSYCRHSNPETRIPGCYKYWVVS
jgi:hypothetical protein